MKISFYQGTAIKRYDSCLSNQLFTGKNISLKIYNPYEEGFSYGDVEIDLNKPDKIKLEKTAVYQRENIGLDMDYSPSRIGTLWDKISRQPIKTLILTSIDSLTGNCAYHFMSENLENEYGYVKLKDSNHLDKYDTGEIYSILNSDYPELGITGNRVIIDYVQNWDSEYIGGIGLLADKMAVKHCLDLGYDLNIVAEAIPTAIPIHYKRGMKVLPISTDTHMHNYFYNRYHNEDLNKIISNIINEQNIIELSGWQPVPMYIPKNIAESYAKDL